MHNRLKRIFLLINLKTLVVTVLAIIATYLCIEHDLTADFPLTLIATAIVFPVVFSINGAYKRREAALSQYGSIKAHGRAICFAARDWLQDSNGETQDAVKRVLGELLASCRNLFLGSLSDMPENERVVYAKFSELSHPSNPAGVQ